MSNKAKEAFMKEKTTQNGVEYEHSFYGTHIDVRGDDGSFSEFYTDHYSKVREARKNMEMNQGSHSEEVSHPLTGQSVVDTTTNKTYHVDRVTRQWWRGYYLMALINHEGSHTTIIIENISSIDPTIINEHQRVHAEFTGLTPKENKKSLKP